MLLLVSLVSDDPELASYQMVVCLVEPIVVSLEGVDVQSPLVVLVLHRLFLNVLFDQYVLVRDDN